MWRMSESAILYKTNECVGVVWWWGGCSTTLQFCVLNIYIQFLSELSNFEEMPNKVCVLNAGAQSGVGDLHEKPDFSS